MLKKQLSLNNKLKFLQMKKSLLILTLLFIFGTTVAQENLFGVRTGFNITNLNFEPEVPEGSLNAHRNGFVIGFLAEYAISRKFSIMPEIQFSAEGAKDKNLRLDYIQLPIFLNYKISNNIALGVGPQVSLKIHDYEDGFKNVVYAAGVGLTYMITDNIFVDARYTLGLVNVFDDNTGLDATNENAQFGVGIKI